MHISRCFQGKKKLEIVIYDYFIFKRLYKLEEWGFVMKKSEGWQSKVAVLS